MQVFSRLLSFGRSTLTYALLLFGTSALAIFATTAVMPEPPTYSDNSERVTRADSWPVSKERHMEKGDLWYWIESRTSGFTRDATQEGASVFEVARAWIPGLTGYHELEILVWTLLLPGLTFSVFGGGIAAHRAASRGESIVAGAVLIAVIALALSSSSEGLYMTMWDASIHWSNWLGWTYYDFTVRFFVIAPLLATGTGLALLLERGRQMICRDASKSSSKRRS